jgi:hypothetical protein
LSTQVPEFKGSVGVTLLTILLFPFVHDSKTICDTATPVALEKEHLISVIVDAERIALFAL